MAGLTAARFKVGNCASAATLTGSRRFTHGQAAPHRQCPPISASALPRIRYARLIGKGSMPARRFVRRGRSTFRSEEHTSELQSLMRISYAVFCLKKKKNNYNANDKP